MGERCYHVDIQNADTKEWQHLSGVKISDLERLLKEGVEDNSDKWVSVYIKHDYQGENNGR
jgi:hypothetical protein